MTIVSVVIPCYKQAHFLAEAIGSVLAQDHPHHEILVIDDDSPDRPHEITSGYRGVRCIHQSRRERSGARNRGLEEATGEFVVFLDADDRLLPDHFSSCLAEFRAHPQAAFVCGDYRWFGEGDVYHVHDCRPRPDHYATLLRHNFIGPPHVVMFRRAVLDAVGGWDERLTCGEDQELYLRVARRHPIRCHHRVIAEYRRHPEQTSQKWDRMLRATMAVWQAEYRHVKGRLEYEKAWREGRDFRRRMYGEPLAWSTVAAARAGDWRRAARYLAVLLRWNPQAVLSLLQSKVARLYEAAR